MTFEKIENKSFLDTTSFAELIEDKELVVALDGLGITTASKVQSAAIPRILSGSDLMVQAQTGSGKTLAFALPIIMMLRGNGDKRGTQSLVIAPTRELALQIREVIKSVARDVKPACLIGGASIKGQVADLRKDSRVVIGTPGRILDLLRQRELVLRKCRQFVLDEADEMLSMGFLEEVRAILSRLPSPRQGMFFSATITPRVKMLAQSFLKHPETIVIDSDNESAPEIEHLFCRVEGGLADKAVALARLLKVENPKSAIVFCNTKSDTELVEVFLQRRGFDARRINSDLSQKERTAIMRDLRSGALTLLIATDVAARGIDVKQLDMVVNYSIHEQAEVYVHRSGRTGRAGEKGRAISLVGPQDFTAFHNLTKTSSIALKEIEVPAEVEDSDEEEKKLA